MGGSCPAVLGAVVRTPFMVWKLPRGSSASWRGPKQQMGWGVCLTGNKLAGRVGHVQPTMLKPRVPDVAVCHRMSPWLSAVLRD